MHLTHHYKRLRLRRLKIAVYAVVISLFFIPTFLIYKSSGENFFAAYVNGVFVGNLSSSEEAHECLLEARRHINSQTDELTFMEPELSVEGTEIVWGQVDSKENVISNIETVLTGGADEMLTRAYVVKVQDEILTINSEDEVKALFQAAIDKRDNDGRFEAIIGDDLSSELPSMTLTISSKEDIETEQETREAEAFNAGIAMEFIGIGNSDYDSDSKLLNEYKNRDHGKVLSMNFVDYIEIAEAYVRPAQLNSLDEAIDDLVTEKETDQIYKVVSGDTLSGIAVKQGISLEELIAINDSLENSFSAIHPDDELIVKVSKPKLTLRWTERAYISESYKAEPIKIPVDTKYTNDIRVLQDPSDGCRVGIAERTFDNDEQVGDTNFFLQDPDCPSLEAVPKVYEQGTKVAPTYIRPISGGRLTSSFGYRKQPKKGASTYHKGVDWGTPIGTPVHASCGGTVAKAGWGSGYGNVIYINHPDGRQTRYGHLSKIRVSAGQHVNQGDVIAYSGNTGVSTGPHLHFEILIGGKQVNPLPIINN